MGNSKSKKTSLPEIINNYVDRDSATIIIDYLLPKVKSYREAGKLKINIPNTFGNTRYFEGLCEGGHYDMYKLHSPFHFLSCTTIRYIFKSGNEKLSNDILSLYVLDVELLEHAVLGLIDGDHLDTLKSFYYIYNYVKYFTFNLPHACQLSKVNIVKYLVEQKNITSDMALAYACKSGNYDLIKYIYNKMEYDTTPTHSRHPLREAYASGNTEIINFITEKFGIPKHPSDINIVLNGACESGDINIVEEVINRFNPTNFTDAISLASIKGSLELIKLLHGYGATITPDNMYQACQTAPVSIIRYIYQHTNYNTNTAIESACMHGNIDAVKFFIDNGFNKWNYGITHACKGGYFHIIILMIDNGATKCGHCTNKISQHITLNDLLTINN